VEHDDAVLPRRRIGAPAAAGHDAAAELRRAARCVRCRGRGRSDHCCICRRRTLVAL